MAATLTPRNTGLEPAQTAESLLVQAERAYRDGEAKYRDTLIATGRLLHAFVLAGLREGDGATDRARHAAGITRCGLVARAAERLGATPLRINHMIHLTAVVDLLSDGGDVGGMGYGALWRFSVFVRRSAEGYRRADGRRDSRRSVSLCETWVVKPDYATAAVELFRRGAREGFTAAQAVAEVGKLFRGGRKGKSRRLSPKAVRKADNAAAAFARAAPGDAADACMRLVLANEDPWQVAQRLIAELQKVPRRKPNPLHFSREAV